MRPRNHPARKVRRRDPYLQRIRKHWDGIVALYEKFKHKKPVLEFDLESGKVYAYPYEDYKRCLTNETSQTMLEAQYKHALKQGLFVIFVRDTRKRKLRSYSFQIEA